MLREYADMKEEIRNLKTLTVQSFYETMLSYCLMYRKNAEGKNPKVVKTNEGRIILASKCAACDS